LVTVEALQAENDELKDYLQLVVNEGRFVCQWDERHEPEDLRHYCTACRVRALLTPGRYLKPNAELLAAQSRQEA
jgi:hypothetical protein